MFQNTRRKNCTGLLKRDEAQSWKGVASLVNPVSAHARGLCDSVCDSCAFPTAGICFCTMIILLWFYVFTVALDSDSAIHFQTILSRICLDQKVARCAQRLRDGKHGMNCRNMWTLLLLKTDQPQRDFTRYLYNA